MQDLCIDNIAMDRMDKSRHDSEQRWAVYILCCRDDSFYTGITTDLERRLHEHNHSPKGARYTRQRRPVALAYAEKFASRAEASRREYEIKQLDRHAKKRLITQAIAQHHPD